MDEPDTQHSSGQASSVPSDRGTVVSIIIPTYNHRDFVIEAVQSVLNQTVREVEIIVINDGSPDDTEQLLRPMVESGKIRYHAQPNAGQAAARNQGIAMARGEFVALLDDDDSWPADHIEWQIAALRAAPDAVMVYGTIQKSNAAAPELSDDAPAIQHLEHFACQCPVMSPGQALFRTSAIRGIGGLDPTLQGTDDWDLYIRLSKHGPILYQNRLALYYRVHLNNASRNYGKMFVNAMRVIDKHFPASQRDPRRRTAIAFARKMAAQIGINLVIQLRRQGRLLAMLRTLVKVIYIRPALLTPTGLWRRMQHVTGHSTPNEPTK